MLLINSPKKAEYFCKKISNCSFNLADALKSRDAVLV